VEGKLTKVEAVCKYPLYIIRGNYRGHVLSVCFYDAGYMS